MSNVIDILERIGGDSRLRHVHGAIQSALACAGIEPGAILGADQAGLETLLEARTNICCMVHAPENDDDAGQPDELTPRPSATRLA